MSHYYYFAFGFVIGIVIGIILTCLWHMMGRSGSNSDSSSGSNSDYTIMWFYSPLCGHCTNMDAEWTKFCSQLPKGISAKKIDINEPKNQQLSVKYGAHAVPYIIKLSSTGSFTIYQGDRTAASLLAFATSI